uniref:Uncharacterized protein n=1 Tax=Lactuca sativa TaxID=4236 RepID=A0A9R1WRI6_LACSA|nr:hypothetical protein LSAT_V11C100040670 [Lactuca sativa]
MSGGQWQRINGCMQYLALNCICFGIDISNDINFIGLVTLVCFQVQILDDSDVRYFLSFVTIMPPNTVQLFVANNVMESGTNRFPRENCYGNGSSGIGSKVFVHADLTVDVDESVNDEAKLMMLVDDGNIIPHGELVEHF